MKRIVFASGKGGTGKTTLTALIAMAASREGVGLALADCDVEAANLPIALKATSVSCVDFAGAARAVLDPATCRGCGACRDVCRFDALAPDEDFFRTRAFVVDQWSCEGCGACVRACPEGSLRMEPTLAGEVCAAGTAAGPMVFGRLAPGQDLSGKLVTEVRNGADAAAVAVDARAVLIDGPPGAGCPAIASITNTDLLIAVTEPTLSGEHDLMRLVGLARRLGVPVAVVLNKADLSVTGAARLRERARLEGLPIVAEVPFDAELGASLWAASDDATPVESPGAAAVRGVWEYLRGHIT